MNRIRTRTRAGFFARLPLGLLLVGCGTDVDLGGTADSGVFDAGLPPTVDSAVLDAQLLPETAEDSGEFDAGPPGAECAPCATGSQCASGVCAVFAGDLFCGTTCTTTSDCAADETCTAETSISSAMVHVCVPTSGACTPVSAPAVDGSFPDHCGTLNGPTITSSCSACGKYSNDCQPNGCYGGYWCNEATRDCGPPPTSCP